MEPAQIASWIVIGMALVISAVTDVVSTQILDAVTYPAMVLGLALRFWQGGPGDWNSGFFSGALGFCLLGGLFALFAWRGKLGWGDVKLAAAVGAALGLELSMAAALFISLVGAVQVVVTLAWQGVLLETLGQMMRRWAERLRLVPAGTAGMSRKIPYGVAISLGTFWAMWWGRATHPW
jgi:prepilin peptidase CpaA